VQDDSTACFQTMGQIEHLQGHMIPARAASMEGCPWKNLKRMREKTNINGQTKHYPI